MCLFICLHTIYKNVEVVIGDINNNNNTQLVKSDGITDLRQKRNK